LLGALSLFDAGYGKMSYTDSILVMGSKRISGGVAPYDTSITINDLPAQFNTDGSFYSKIPLNRGENRITAIATITDVAGQHHNCSNERLVIYPEVLSCTVSILQPEDSLTVNTDSMLVIASANVTGGVQPYVDSTCTINGIPASIRPDGFLQARLPVQLGLNKVAVTCAFTDSVGTQTSCSDTLTLIGGEFACELTIISPEDGHKQCSAHFNLYLDHRLRGAIGNPETWCVVNGDTAEVTDDGLFHAHTVLAPGYNAVLINCTSIDSLKRRAVCLDTLTIFVDRTPAIGELERSDPPTIRGRVYDWESGIQSISIVSQRDADLHIDEFEPGQKQVNFVAYRTGENSGPSFMLRVVNGAGCVMEYDPISVRIEPPDACEFSFTIPQADRYLNIDNYGVHKIHMQINELQIDFIADEQGTDAPGSAYFIPLEGARTIDILNFLQSGDNALHMWCEGPAGSYAEIFIADVMLSRQTTAVEMENRKLAALPTEFTLNQNYPNPFNMRTIISFAIPPGWNEPVKLVLYNANGQLVKTLFNEKVPPGNYRVWWDGRDNNGHEVASGMYLYRIISGRQALVKKLLLTK
ncbi:MAG: T9SS C-terminal target domain-containing protein, partial [Calditrichaeota bacterium]